MEEHCGATSVAEELECAEQPQRQVFALGDRFRSYNEMEDQLMSFESFHEVLEERGQND